MIKEKLQELREIKKVKDNQYKKMLKAEKRESQSFKNGMGRAAIKCWELTNGRGSGNKKSRLLANCRQLNHDREEP